ncbi:MAG TPA: tetratricopeptide repeat protein [Candidatus Angelobacter sp.]|nr:tetratricopeptide repeat protein [Candidatus Angelobacter sp.]
MERYDRSDVLRILRITARQLAGWEKAGLLPAADSYSFFDLLQIKKLRDLRAKRVRSAVIRESLQAMRRVAGMENPLLEASSFASRSRVVFRHQGTAVEPLAGQFVMDFAERNVVESPNVRSMRSAESASDYFSRGVSLEEDPSTQLEAIENYKKCVELDPLHAAAYINLGTLFYNRHDYQQAERFYRKAIEVDPRYALAYFDLGNVLDETGRLPDAIRAYESAISLAPTYADAHYNLALAFEKARQPRKALTHWEAYARLDTIGPWSIHAKNQVKKILAADTLKVMPKKK